MEAYEAGRSLDKLIAERVLGWDVERDSRGVWYQVDRHTRMALRRLPGYSTNMAAAWQVVESMSAISRSPSLANTRFAYWFDGAHLWACSTAEAALEICNAALRILDTPPPA